MCFTDIGIPILTIYKTVVKRTKVTDASRVESISRPCCIRVVRIKSVSHSHHIRIESEAMIIWPSRSTFVRITSVRRPCRVRVTSLPYPCVNLHKDMPRMWHEYDKDNTDAGRTWHEGDTDLIRTFVRVSYFDCLKIIDTDKFGPADCDGHDTDVIRTWTGRQGHDTDTCPCHVRVSIRVCVNVALVSQSVNRKSVSNPSHEHNAVSNHWQLNYVFDSLFRLTIKKT